MNRKIESWVLLGLAGIFGGYVLLRAWLLPITVDESTTVFNHVPRLVVDTLAFQGESNPNNHILNTLLIKILTGIFGWHHFVVRLPVLIGAFLYAWASVRLARKMSDNAWVRIFALLMLFGNPYLLEFFSLARGYGLAVGLMTMALWQSWRFFESNEPKALRNAFLFAGFAVYANFTLLLFFAPFVALMIWSTWQLNPTISAFWKQSKPAIQTVGIFVLLWIAPLRSLSTDAQLIHLNALGTFFESVRGAVWANIHSNNYLGANSDLTFTWMIFLGVFVIMGIGFWRWWQQGFRWSSDPRIFMVLMLLGVSLANMAQVSLTHTPYLQARLSLFYWPLFALALGAAAAWVYERFGLKKSWIVMAPLLLVFSINTVRSVNIYTTFEWFHDSDTFTILEYLKKTYQAEGRTEPYLFDTEWFMQNSFLFHLEKGNYGYDKYVKLVPYHNRQTPQGNSDFYYAVNFDTVKDVMDSYDVVLRIPNSSLILLRKK